MKLENFAKNLVNVQTKKPWIFIVAALLISTIFIPGILSLVNNVEPSLEKVLPQDIEEVELMNNMRTEYGADMVYILFYAEDTLEDVRQQKSIRYMDILAKKLRHNDYILEVTSIADLVKLDNNGVIPESYKEIKHDLDSNVQSSMYMNRDYSVTIMQIRSDTGAEAQIINDVINDIDDDIQSVENYNPGYTTAVTGFNAIDKATFNIIISDFMLITMFSFLFIGITVFITFRSLIKGMLPMVVVMLALVWTMGIAGYLGITITVVTMVAAAMIMGLGIDFGIHIVHNFFTFRNKGVHRVKAMKDTMQELLRAMIGSSLTTSAGFLALVFGVLPTMKSLGVILAIGIISTLLGAVFVLPAVVYSYDKTLKKIKPSGAGGK